MSARRIAVDRSMMQVGTDEAQMAAPHIVEQDGFNWNIRAATMLDVGTLRDGPAATVAVTLYHTTPIGTRLGLAYTLSPLSARETAAALIRAVEELEEAAAKQAADVLNKVRGK